MSARHVGWCWLLAGLCALAATPVSASGPATGDWNFNVFLDATQIGTHRFRLTATGPAGGAGASRSLSSEADFKVKLLGLTVYRYRHRATELWQGDCLASLVASTDDDGEMHLVRAEADANARRAPGEDEATPKLPAGTPSDVPPVLPPLRLTGCVMSFAYWNPALRTQNRLLNAQTGLIEPVRVTRAEDGLVELRGQSVKAVRWRITGPVQPVDIWYSPEGDWLGLDATVRGGRQLRYRLQ